MTEKEIRKDFKKAIDIYGSNLGCKIDYALSDEDISNLAILYRDYPGYKSKITDILTDCNFHTESMDFRAGRYSDYIIRKTSIFTQRDAVKLFCSMYPESAYLHTENMGDNKYLITAEFSESFFSPFRTFYFVVSPGAISHRYDRKEDALRCAKTGEYKEEKDLGDFTMGVMLLDNSNYNIRISNDRYKTKEEFTNVNSECLGEVITGCIENLADKEAREAVLGEGEDCEERDDWW